MVFKVEFGVLKVDVDVNVNVRNLMKEQEVADKINQASAAVGADTDDLLNVTKTTKEK